MARHGLCLFSGGELWAAPRRTEKRRNSEGGKGDFFDGVVVFQQELTNMVC